MSEFLSIFNTLVAVLMGFFMFLYKNMDIVYLPACIAVMIYAYKNDRDQFKVDLIWPAKFIAFMFILLFVRLASMTGKYTAVPSSLSFLGFLSVPFEDMFFVMIPFYISKKISKNIGKVMVWLFFSILFSVGHLYQGIVAALITALYPYFISNRFAAKTSFLNVMICHFLYDSFTLLGVKIGNILWYLGGLV
jgi:hypothetical protein